MVIDSDPELNSFHLAKLVDEISTLQEGVEAFVALEESEAGPTELYHRVLARVHQLCASAVACEDAGFTREQIVRVLEPVRRIHARSDFVRRLQEWPRGYPGDFETVEYLCAGRSRAEQGTIEDICETYSLTRSIAQQHRNKVQHQAARIMRTLLRHPSTARVFSIACGSCPDFRQIAAHLPALLGELWLNDSDPEALTFSARHLGAVRDRMHLRPGNALKVVAKDREARSDLRPRPRRRPLRLPAGQTSHLPHRARLLAAQARRHVLLHQHRARQSVSPADRVLRRLVPHRAHRRRHHPAVRRRGHSVRPDHHRPRGDRTDAADRRPSMM